MLYKLFFSSVFVCCITQAKIKFETTPSASLTFKNASLEIKNKLDKAIYVTVNPLKNAADSDKTYTTSGFKIDGKKGSKESEQGYLRIHSENFIPNQMIQINISYVAANNITGSGNRPDFSYVIQPDAETKKVYLTFEKSFFSSLPELRAQSGKKMKIDGKEVKASQSGVPLAGNVTKKNIHKVTYK